MTTTFDAMLAQLHNVKANGKGFTAQCPAHDDSRNSLSVSRADDGKILLHCFAGCETPAIADALGLKMNELFAKERLDPNGRAGGREIIATYDYADERGALLYQCVRYAPKDFRQRRPNGAGGWEWSLNGTRRVLYRLPELLARSDEIVFLVEGEKDADNLARLGLLATTNAGGANTWREEYAESLHGRQVVIIPDNDDAGRQHAARVAHSLQDRAASVKILELPNLPPKGDVSDWLNAGGEKDTLLELAARAFMYADARQTDAAYLPFDEILAAFGRGETGDAEILARLFADKIAYDHAENAWYLFHKHFWTRDETGKVEKFVTDQLAAQYLFAAAERKRKNGEDAEKQVKELYARANSLRYRNKIANVLDRARKQDALALRGDEWDKDAMLLAVANGVLNLRYRDFEFRDGAPRDYIRTTAPTLWQDLYAPAPRWEQFLQEIFAGDAEIIAFVQRLLGYGITGETSEHIFPVLYGEGRNGKDTLLETLKFVLGDCAAPVQAEVLLASERNPNAATPHLYALRGKRLCWVNESNEGARLNTSQVKMLTGGGTIAARPLYGTPITFAPQYLLMLVTNHKPHANADDYALWKRLLLIPFTQAFVDSPRAENKHEHKRDAKLAETLRAEASGILAWLVRGCLDWQHDGLNPPASVTKATDDYQNEEDTLSEFIAACCMVKENAETKAAELYAAYRQWTADNGLAAMSGTAFGKRMGKRFEKRTRGGGHIVYVGLGLLVQV